MPGLEHIGYILERSVAEIKRRNHQTSGREQEKEAAVEGQEGSEDDKTG